MRPTAAGRSSSRPTAECVHVGGASHGGRLYRENVRGHLRYLSLHGRRGRGRARPASPAGVAPRPRAPPPRRARAALPRGGVLARLGRRRHADRRAGLTGWAPLVLVVQLVFGFAVVLAPGAAVARALGIRSFAATVAWGLALVFGALALTFLVSASLTFTLVLLLAAGLAALPFARRRHAPHVRMPGRGPVLARGSGPRPRALARRRRDRRRRVLPPRARPEAPRVRRPLPRERQRVRRRRAPSRLCVPALARAARARRQGLGRRPGRRRPARAVRPRSDRGGRRLRGGLGLLPPGRAGRRLRGRGRRARGDGARGGRRADRPRAARDELAAAPRPGGARAGGRGDAAPVAPAPRLDRGGLPRRSRSSTRRTPSSSGSRSRASSSSAGCGPIGTGGPGC